MFPKAAFDFFVFLGFCRGFLNISSSSVFLYFVFSRVSIGVGWGVGTLELKPAGLEIVCSDGVGRGIS